MRSQLIAWVEARKRGPPAASKAACLGLLGDCTRAALAPHSSHLTAGPRPTELGSRWGNTTKLERPDVGSLRPTALTSTLRPSAGEAPGSRAAWRPDSPCGTDRAAVARGPRAARSRHRHQARASLPRQSHRSPGP